MSLRRSAFVPCLLLLTALLGAGLARPQDEEPERWGWLRQIDSPDTDSRLIEPWPSAAFVLEEGEALSPLVTAGGPRDAVFSTRLRIKVPGRYRFGLEAAGGIASLRVGGSDSPLAVLESFGAADETVALSQWIALERGALDLQVTFEGAQGTTAGPARLRTLWELENSPKGGFPLEPIPSRATRVTVPEAYPARGPTEQRLLAAEGRLLLETKGCTNCHDADRNGARATGVRIAPHLSGVGDRISGSWMFRWLSGPHRVRANADMPGLLSPGPAGIEEARALTHFLASQRLLPGNEDFTGSGWEAATEKSVLDGGRRLYHTRGCVACHGALASPAQVFEDEFASDVVPEVDVIAPFGDLAGKWRPSALARYLVDPVRFHPDGRMPSLSLNDEEADLIANYLVTAFGGEAEPLLPDRSLAQRGSLLFSYKRCRACHQLPGYSAPDSPPLAVLDPTEGCLSPDAELTPRYDLTEREHAALVHGLESMRHDLAAGVGLSPLERGRRTMDRLGCLACHESDGRGGPPEELAPYFVSTDERVDLGDEGRLPPDLTGVGTKLNTGWIEEVLLAGGRARPYLETRMPQYGVDLVGGLPEFFAKAEGVRPHTDTEPPPVTDEMVLTGRRLMSSTNLGCMACHVYADYPPSGTPGPAITDFAERVRYEWFRTYLNAPQRFKPGSRMPDFSTGGVSTVQTVLGGDMARQTDAIWGYFTLGEKMPEPEGVSPGGSMQVGVFDRPVVVRAFLADVGARGIAVGLPVGIHFAFDANRSRLAQAWQGDFVDMSGSWAGRGGNTLAGQGPAIWEAPAGPALLIQSELPAEWPTEVEQSFGGYRLEADGSPVFQYELQGIEVHERFDATISPELGIVRRFEFPDVRQGTRVLLNHGATSFRVLDQTGWSSAEQHTIGSDEVLSFVRNEESGVAVIETRYQP